MRISDWSSDVCSSDLMAAAPVNFVIGTVYNKGIRKFWNFIAGKIGLGKLDSIPLLQFQKGGVADLRKGAKLPGFKSEEHTSELQSLMRISYAVFCLKNKKQTQQHTHHTMNHHTNTHLDDKT